MRRSEGGAALITVLMIVAIVVVIAVNMTGRLQLQLQRQHNLQQQQQAFWYAMGAEHFARVLLSRSLSGEETVNLKQDWAQSGASFVVTDGNIGGEITDLQACFNLNALQQAGQRGPSGRIEQTAAQRSFTRLVELVATDLSMPAEYLMARVHDWLDEDSLLSTAGSAEEDDYAALQFPYYTANSLMVSVSELRQILDITPADLQMLLPFVCVIPENTQYQLNINTLTEQTAILLAALIPELTEADAIDLIAERPENGFNSIDELLALPQLAGIEMADDVKALLAVKSSYFQLLATTSYLESGFVLTSIFRVDDENTVRVLARRFGGQG
ncbi:MULTISPECIES: type II secretion system minor pseudopilin GspK [unclassified Arsukibacterium]|uniref:type II secretion system minor pseudopilin GspK n=1 Tax=unclassified Arsukibacterium TaxID=2635278 RepID=UPI000C5B0594|nr:MULTISPECIES: type II secretion system minor pseudopilin GspK [unclassified Arsukibacterium]MAA94875.1 type II secretory pathway protein [Rheinheimera sp.]MBM34678.1 type II secretory pathway protein [Rheinheimera sp.]|tara:strand:+ start:74608 stop:75594 length:987 start_codon:yes stop_codon:yes gene_type:complete